MKNIFSQTKDYVKQPKRNVFDLTFHNHGTYNFGYLYPVFCKETIPGDSFMIDPTFALRFLPTAFPVQTKVTANLHFFYVRNRNLWDNWKKFITHTDDVQFPYLDGNQSSIRTSGLADYLGVPTTSVGKYQTNTAIRATDLLVLSKVGASSSLFTFEYTPYLSLDDVFFNFNDLGSALKNLVYQNDEDSTVEFANKNSLIIASDVISTPYPEKFSFRYNEILQLDSSREYRLLLFLHSGGLRILAGYCDIDFPSLSVGSNVSFSVSTPLNGWNFVGGSSEESFSTIGSLRDRIASLVGNNPISFGFQEIVTNPVTDHKGFLFYTLFDSNGGHFSGTQYLADITYPSGFSSENAGVSDIADLPPSFNPFNQTIPNSIRLSALPFRAYESIYNSFYRNDQNDPLMINGKPEYDVYVPNTGDGSDDYPYKLYKRNWELDFLTSAVQSPQQGIAPLVGVSQQGDFTFVNKDSDGNIGYFTAKANFSNDGNTITGFKLSDKVELNGIPSNPVDSADVPDEIKRGTIYSLNQMALAGISINDFRNVNSLQRWLETNIRRGYKYRDQIKSHYGVDIDEKILDMPEFIGGVSSPVFSSQVNQTVETESDPLGSYAGQLSLITDSKHSIKHYCDEHGFIIGILSIVPVPNYSQLLPKHFLKYNYLDYYFPEFAHIGMQPIDYREVCPVQQFGVDPTGLSDTFGYQRPWYDYIASVDEVHGLFRTNLRNFVLNRQFDSKPVLNADFLQVDPEQLNDIFTVQDVSDKILGQIKFNVIAKRPIPKFGIPRLE